MTLNFLRRHGAWPPPSLSPRSEPGGRNDPPSLAVRVLAGAADAFCNEADPSGDLGAARAARARAVGKVLAFRMMGAPERGLAIG